MHTTLILTNIAIVLLTAAVWDDMRRGERLTPARRTWLTVAGLFAIIGVLLQVLGD
jgi:hypothetical protein